LNPTERIREHMPELRDTYKVARIGVFGSYARGSATESSDVDVAVEFSERVDLFHFIGLQEYLSEILEIKVDLVTFKGLKPLVKERVLKEVLYV